MSAYFERGLIVNVQEVISIYDKPKKPNSRNPLHSAYKTLEFLRNVLDKLDWNWQKEKWLLGKDFCLDPLPGAKNPEFWLILND